MSSRRARAERIRRLLETEGDAVYANTTHFNEARYAAAAADDDFEANRERARAIKADAIERLPELVETLRDAVEANGGECYLADDADDAAAYVESVCADHDAETLVKSKSMTSKEVGVNDRLAAAGVDVYETDLGEFVVQVADEAPSHLVGPAIHKSTDDIAALFNAVFEPAERLETPEALTNFARDYLGERIRAADVGMTGANFLLAESGTVVLVTNEGNARKCAVTPPVHVAVAGIEKVLPSLAELPPFVDLIGKTAGGQSMARYVSLLTPPVDSPTVDFDRPDEPIGAADREFHLVLVDNGRWAMREDEQLRETLYCIRCGACANCCGNFQQVGGHAFGGETYTGGIGTGWEAGVEGLETAGEFTDLCTGCSRCVPACPVKIDIPWINTVVRDRLNRGAEPGAFDPLVAGLTPDAEPGGMDRQKRFFGNVEPLLRLGSATAPVSNWLASSRPVRWLLARAVGLDPGRDLPRFRRETLRDWHAGRTPAVGADRAVVVYPDPYTNYVRVDRGRAAVRVLEALGCAVELADAPESGRAALSQGMVATAAERAEAVHAALAPHLEAGRDVVVIEPSDLAMFRRDYARLLPEADHDALAGGTYELGEYLAEQLGDGAEPGRLAAGDGVEVAYHSHCQQRTLDLEAPTVAVLEARGFDVTTASVECCGMAGSFGYKREYAELSRAVGEPLAETFAGHEGPVAASGTSCAEQLEALLGRPAVHPVELLDPASG
ncbi:MAG: LUD domain-containing protein [Halobacteriales archaeon]